jgi:glycosyltransferase involved in cell wall biosynthesis
MSRCALLATDRELLPRTTGNRLRILGVIAALRVLGWKVVLIGIPGAAPLEQLRRLVDRFVAVHTPPFQGGELIRFDPTPFRRAVDRLARELKPSVAIAEYVWLAPALKGLPPLVRRVVDCHDVFHERTERFRAASLHPWVICTREQERRRLAIGDVILATQEREAALLRRLLPRKRVVPILTPIDLPPAFVRSRTEGHVVLTVGANHPGNAAVLEFARDVWPHVLARVPDARLQVVGSIASLLPPLPGVDRIGYVENLETYYAAASVVVCPVRVGTGVKTKMLEALRFGKATVVTTMAAEGMPAPARRTWITARTFEHCANQITDILCNPTERAELEDAAYEYGERHLGQAPFRAQVATVLPNRLLRTLARLSV